MLIGVYGFITQRTVIGRHVYAIGGNVDAATMSGVRTRRIDFLVMTNMGFLAALAGMVTAARLTAANPKAGTNFELDAIAAAFIGGAAVTGGVGTVVGAIIGGLVMGVLNNGMSLMGISIDWQQTVKGLVLLAAVAFDVWNKKRTSVGGGAGAEDTASTAPPPDGARGGDRARRRTRDRDPGLATRRHGRRLQRPAGPVHQLHPEAVAGASATPRDWSTPAPRS